MRLGALALVPLFALLIATGTPAVADQIGTTPPNASCVIKGNINDKNERIYHLPGDPWYAKTKLDPSKGERWFCSEKEAVAAGWRTPKN